MTRIHCKNCAYSAPVLVPIGEGALELYGYSCQRIAARIHDLKQLGYQIERRMVEVATRDGGTTRVAEYRLVLAKSEVAA